MAPVESEPEMISALFPLLFLPLIGFACGNDVRELIASRRGVAARENSTESILKSAGNCHPASAFRGP
jgi:hypothetical protein